MLSAYAEAGQAAQGVQGSILQSPLPMMIIIFCIFYFLLIRPQQKEQQKKQQEHKSMLEALTKNDEVITSGGIHGTVVNVKDDSVVLRVDDNVKMQVQKTSISRLRKKRDKQ